MEILVITVVVLGILGGGLIVRNRYLKNKEMKFWQNVDKPD